MHRASPIALFLAAVGAPLAFLALPDASFDRYELPKEALLAACATAALVPLLWRLRPDGLDLWALLFAGASLASTLLSNAPPLARRHLALTTVATALFLAARAQAGPTRRALHAVLLGAAAVAALVALGEAWGLVTGLSSRGRAPGSLLGQRNLVAHLCLLASPLAWAAASSPRRAARTLGLAAAAALAAAVVLTRSRAAWLVAPLPLGVWAALQPGGLRRPWPLLAVAVGVALAVAAPTRLVWKSDRPLADTLRTLVDAERGSGHGRLVQARASLGLLADAPLLGAGPGHWQAAYPSVRPPQDPTFDPDRPLPTGRLPNSDWLALAVERGLLGSAAALAFAAALARALWRRRDDPLARAALAMTLAAAALGLFDAVVHLAAPAGLLAVALGAALPRAEGQPPGPPWPRAAPVVLWLLCVAATAQGVSHLAGLWARTRPDAGLRGLEQTVRLDPGDLRTRFELAEALLLEGRCADAAPHVAFLRHALPHHPSARRMAQACGQP